MMKQKQSGGSNSFNLQAGENINFINIDLESLKGVFNGAAETEQKITQLLDQNKETLNKLYGQSSVLSQPVISVISKSLILPKDYYRRNNLFSSITELLKMRTILIVTGSSGMGKTSAVFDACKEDEKDWGIVRLRDYGDPEIIKDYLTRLLVELKGGLVRDVIIDDLEVRQDIRLFLPVLKEVIEFQQSKNNKIILTCDHAMDSFIRDLGLCKDQVISVSLFSEDEVSGYLEQLGCDNEVLRRKWKAVVYLHSSAGHPQMVNAIATGARGNGFQEIEIDSLLSQPKEVKNEQDRVRIILSDLDDAPRNLLYRLSLVIKILSRTQILNIASIEEPIKESGNVLDKIIGTWVEEIGQDMYRISPLVRDSGRSVNGDDWVQKTHIQIAWALIKGKRITAYDISNIILHSIMGKNTAPMIPLVRSLITAEKRIWEEIAECDNLLSVFTPDSRKAAEYFGKKDDMFALFPLRILQYKVADAKKDDAKVQAVLQNFKEEFPKSGSEEGILFARYMFLSTILLNHYNECISYQDMLEFGQEYIYLSEKLGDNLKDIQPNIIEGTIEIKKLSDVASITIATQIKNTADLECLVKICDTSEKDISIKMLSFIGNDETNADFILSRIWLSEHNSKNPDWDRYLTAVGKLYELSKELSLLPLAREAGKVMSRVIGEQQLNIKGALILSDRIANEIGDSLSLKEGRARLKVSAGDENSVREAIVIWDEVLPQWKRTLNLSVDYAYSNAARAAAKLGDIKKATSFFIDGFKVAMTKPTKIAFLFEIGFCYWKLGEKLRALEHFIEAIKFLQNEQKDSSRNPLFTIQKRLGHILASIGRFQDGTEDLSDPDLVGCVSNFFNTIGEEEIKQTPIEYIIFALLQFEVSENLGKEAYNLFHHVIEKSQNLQTVYLSSVAKSALKYDNETLFAEATFESTLLLKELKQSNIDSNNFDLKMANFLKDSFVKATTSLLEQDKFSQDTITKWKNALGKKQYCDLDNWLESVSGILISKEIDADDVMECIFVDIKADEILRQIAALSIICDNNSSPSRVIECQSFIIARYFLLSKSEVEFLISFGKLIKKIWSKIISGSFSKSQNSDKIESVKKVLGMEVANIDDIMQIIIIVKDMFNLPPNSMTNIAISKYSNTNQSD